jgi:hypothetical protein
MEEIIELTDVVPEPDDFAITVDVPPLEEFMEFWIQNTFAGLRAEQPDLADAYFSAAQYNLADIVEAVNG